jgi:hypothetical protein
MSSTIRALSAGCIATVLAVLVGGCQTSSQSQGQPPSMPTPPSSPSSSAPSSPSSGAPGSPGAPSTPSTPSSGIPKPAGQPPPTDATVGTATDVFEEARERRRSTGGEPSDIPPPPKTGAEGEDEATAQAGTEAEAEGEPAQGGDAQAGADATTDEAGDGAGTTAAATGGQPGSPSGAARGSDETGAATGDGELDSALEDFDGSILAERGVILARANETAGMEEGDSPPPEGKLEKSTGGAGGAMPMPSAMPPIPDAPPPPAPGKGGSETAQADLPKDLPDARDDDVVARQLREAAMKETDPVLREKLWEEYRRYKSGR